MAGIVEFNVDNTLCATVGLDGLLKVWDTVTGAVRAQRNADLSDKITSLSWCSLAPSEEVRNRTFSLSLTLTCQAPLLC